jgi:hypothetical protein
MLPQYPLRVFHRSGQKAQSPTCQWWPQILADVWELPSRFLAISLDHFWPRGNGKMYQQTLRSTWTDITINFLFKLDVSHYLTPDLPAFGTNGMTTWHECCLPNCSHSHSKVPVNTDPPSSADHNIGSLYYLTTISWHSCQLVYLINIVQSADCPHAQQGSRGKWKTIVLR